jgi:hypothetical protein
LNLPVLEIVRVLANLEAVIGVFFMAIEVASLVSSANLKRSQ